MTASGFARTAGPGGPQDPEKVSDRWHRLRTRLRLPEDFRIHDLCHSHVTNALEAGQYPGEVSANVRHHSPGYTMARYGHSRADGARKLAANNASRVGLGKSCSDTSQDAGALVARLDTRDPEKQKNP
ncbi:MULTISPECIES: hypothetical protein [Streptomyces]|uniref:hypothetical protein n=1 Tax=Streptomyces TaxID=1883 RepID=UPI0022489A51|nr:hypothetical protein [Streptomyces sp. JHD 1]MCX2968002.1 hypothetical protein [Streptomyces sp. JHD 1]